MSKILLCITSRNNINTFLPVESLQLILKKMVSTGGEQIGDALGILLLPGVVEDRHACHLQRAAQFPAALGRIHGAHQTDPPGQRCQRLCGEDEGTARLWLTLWLRPNSLGSEYSRLGVRKFRLLEALPNLSEVEARSKCNLKTSQYFAFCCRWVLFRLNSGNQYLLPALISKCNINIFRGEF